VLVGVCAAVVLWLVLDRIWPVLVLFGAGIAIAHLLDPYLDALQRRGWTRLQAVWFVSLLGVVALGLLMTWLVPSLIIQVQSMARAWPTYTARANDLYDSARNWVLQRVDSDELEKQYAEYLDQQWRELQAWLAEKLPALVRWASEQVFRWLGFGLVLAMLVIISFHFMLVIDDFRAGLRGMIPAAAAPHVATFTSQIGYLLGQYLRGLVTTAACVGAFTALGLGLLSLYFGTRYWLLIGFLAGVLYFVPWVGGAIAQVVAVFFGYTTAGERGVWAALASWAVVAAMNQLGDTVLMPRIVGRRVGLHPLAVLFGVLAGYNLFGVAGVMVATPLMVSVKIILAHWLPVKGAPPTERRPREPLALDLGAAMSKAYGLLRGWGGRLERAMGRPERAQTRPAEESADPGAEPPPEEEPEQPEHPADHPSRGNESETDGQV